MMIRQPTTAESNIRKQESDISPTKPEIVEEYVDNDIDSEMNDISTELPATLKQSTQDLRTLSSFRHDSTAPLPADDSENYTNRIPMLLKFNNKTLKSFAEEKYENHRVMALNDLTVLDFKYEIFTSLNLPRLKPGVNFIVTFSGISEKFSIKFEHKNRLKEVYERIRIIEADRASLTKTCSTRNGKKL